MGIRISCTKKREKDEMKSVGEYVKDIAIYIAIASICILIIFILVILNRLIEGDEIAKTMILRGVVYEIKCLFACLFLYTIGDIAKNVDKMSNEKPME